jgi:NCS1 nucleoside transporter family
MSESLDVREGEYGDKVWALEPGGVEAIPEKERHGKARDLFGMWMSPNLEFATIFVGALGIIAFGLNFWESVIAIVLGNALGALSQYFLTQDGPRYGVPQMVVGRAAFGKLGNIFPSVVNAGAAGIGWFAVNSVSGAFALATLTKLSDLVSLVLVVIAQIVIAFIGHNLVQAIEKYLFPFLLVFFAIATAIVLFSHKAHLGGSFPHKTIPGGFLILMGAAYGYAAGWNPFSSDYSRYLPSNTDKKKAGLSAGLGIFISASVLEIVGAAAGTTGLNGNPTTAFTHLLPDFIGNLILIGIVLGSICANVLNIYSGAMSFLTIGLKIGSNFRRGLFIVIFGIIGLFLAHSAMKNPANNYENFLLIMSYWIGPWLGVVFADKVLRKGKSVEKLLYASRENWAGPVSFLIGAVLSILGFCNQSWNNKPVLGFVVKHYANIGDITFLVGFVLSFVIYYFAAGSKVKAE